ncbi:MAG: hypothetical protein HYY04_10475 [Chloroflexi bacterium]|nr:hypothetical protein [Chloroflexota bacterium]
MVRYGEFREALQRLHWGEGLTRIQMWRQNQRLPRELLDRLPPDFRFRGPGEVMDYLYQLRRQGIDATDPLMAPVMPPIGYGDSPTGRTFATPDLKHGVGSGAGTIPTDASAQTGAGRGGTGDER